MTLSKPAIDLSCDFDSSVSNSKIPIRLFINLDINMVDKKKRREFCGGAPPQSIRDQDVVCGAPSPSIRDHAVVGGANSSEEDDDHPRATNIVVDRFAISKGFDSISKMYRDIDARARTPTLAEEMYPWLREGYWDDPRAIKLGYLFKFNFHHNVARRCSEIAMKRDNIGMKPSVFVWRAMDTPKFLNETLIPLEEECSRNPPEDLLKGIYPKYLESEMTDSEFFVKEITRTSPSGEIKLRPFIRRLTWSRSDSIGVYIRWFMQIQKPINLKPQSANNDREIEWSGYHLSVDLPTFRLILGRIPLIYEAYLEEKRRNRAKESSTDHDIEEDEDCC